MIYEQKSRDRLLLLLLLSATRDANNNKTIIFLNFFSNNTTSYGTSNGRRQALTFPRRPRRWIRDSDRDLSARRASRHAHVIAYGHGRRRGPVAIIFNIIIRDRYDKKIIIVCVLRTQPVFRILFGKFFFSFFSYNLFTVSIRIGAGSAFDFWFFIQRGRQNRIRGFSRHFFIDRSLLYWSTYRIRNALFCNISHSIP